MLDFRPHTLQVVTFTSGGFDEYGVPQPDTESTEDVPCRIVPNGSARELTFSDGTSHVYSFTVYLNQDCRKFDIGEKVRLIGLDGLVDSDREYKVLGFFRNQLNACLWV